MMSKTASYSVLAASVRSTANYTVVRSTANNTAATQAS